MGLNSKRLIFLDSVKGLAAFCVLTGHFYMLFQQSMPETVRVIERIPVANLIVNGRYAVCLFVVISNYIIPLRFNSKKHSLVAEMSARASWASSKERSKSLRYNSCNEGHL